MSFVFRLLFLGEKKKKKKKTPNSEKKNNKPSPGQKVFGFLLLLVSAI
jgi:hypothetical protein